MSSNNTHNSIQFELFADSAAEARPVANENGVATPQQPKTEPSVALESIQLQSVAGFFCDQFLTDRDVAKRYGVARQTVWRWVKSDPDFPPPVQIAKGTTRWRLSELVAFEVLQAGQGGKQ